MVPSAMARSVANPLAGARHEYAAAGEEQVRRLVASRDGQTRGVPRRGGIDAVYGVKEKRGAASAGLRAPGAAWP